MKTKHRTANAEQRTPKSMEIPQETRAEILASLKRGKVYTIRPGDIVVVTAAAQYHRQIKVTAAKVFDKGVKIITKIPAIGLKVLRKKQ